MLVSIVNMNIHDCSVTAPDCINAVLSKSRHLHDGSNAGGMDLIDICKIDYSHPQQNRRKLNRIMCVIAVILMDGLNRLF